MDPLVLRQLAPHGVLRTGLNLANFLLVGVPDAQGNPTGIGPDLARMIASRLGVPLACVPFASPRELADAAGQDVWDICLVASEPERAQTIAFTRAYLEIDATCLVRTDSPVLSAQSLDRPGVRIAAAAGSAYELWLRRHVTRARLIRLPTHKDAYDAFAQAQADALAGLRPGLLRDEKTLTGVRLLDGCFTSIQQAIGTHLPNEAAAAFLERIVEEATAAGMIDELIERHKVSGVRAAVSPRVAKR
ncbi:transporter substrate-binding domain-containing protein [Paraburkholderia susongensis]|uniref:Amino acid ABC transporter substrate-binding protein, PAAT family n=1 Tax=Paraburkholderia susongensis TaxID=1515439 RepID=A0A1X7M2V7_9BURK|nr:transporter substrate-binding domain-containing protein [Paraburkholderia susongensis]SMG60094.1 amino acid ABC transporter substrate-binding protein, PAAT family [Paraburkholderia susongensis]